MDPRQQATFIPRTPVTSLKSNHRAIGFFSLISLIIFLVTALAGGGLYFYKISLNKSLDQLSLELKKQEDVFDVNFIADIVRVNNRIETSKKLLNNHIAVSNLLKNLSENTLPTIQFTDFTFSSSNTKTPNGSSLNLSVKGIARDYTSLAAQSQQISKATNFQDPIFSAFTLTQEGRVGFVLDSGIKQDLLNYRAKNLPSSVSNVVNNTATTTVTNTITP